MDEWQQSHISADSNVRSQDGNTGVGNADIVVGADGSPESFAALRWALREAQRSGQHVNAVFGWTPSWELGAEPHSDDDWDAMRARILERLQGWVRDASQGLSIDPSKVELTPERASGAAALLRIGQQAQQIVVGRRNLGRVMRWLTTSTSASLAEGSQVPVTIVRSVDSDEHDVQSSIAAALGFSVPADQLPPARDDGDNNDLPDDRPIVVGVDGSPAAEHALRFAMRLAMVRHMPVHAVYCWQFKELGVIPGYENAIAPLAAGQQYAEKLVHDIVERELPLDEASAGKNPAIRTHAFHITPAKGLLSASRYASHMVIGTRGLNGLDAHFLGSVSRQIVNLAQCTVTVVH
ncbi:MAG: universal stress protein [Bifidobacterium sp.]|nr:universal stress protein [Bifidobacterium sp.]